MRRWWRRNERTVLGTATIVVLLALWEWGGVTGRLDPIFYSRPTKVLQGVFSLFREDDMGLHLRVSFTEFILGFSLALAVGLPVGVVVGWSRRLTLLLDPLLMGWNATPRSALIPILVIWAGLGIMPKVLVVFLGGLLPLLVNTMAGVRNADPALVRVARSFGASPWALAFQVLLPGALPYVLAGVRLGLNMSLLGVIVGEMYVATHGIGHLIMLYGGAFRINELLAAIVLVSSFGCLLVVAVRALERVLVPWQQH